jgi:hypothetical protein
VNTSQQMIVNIKEGRSSLAQDPPQEARRLHDDSLHRAYERLDGVNVANLVAGGATECS